MLLEVFLPCYFSESLYNLLYFFKENNSLNVSLCWIPDCLLEDTEEQVIEFIFFHSFFKLHALCSFDLKLIIIIYNYFYTYASWLLNHLYT